MTSDQKLALATTFTLGDHARIHVTVEMTDNGHGPRSGDGAPRWAIRSGRECLAVATETWDWEPSPSNRDDHWLNQHRYNDLDRALAVAQAVLDRTNAELTNRAESSGVAGMEVPNG